jgi:hypothetical protein
VQSQGSHEYEFTVVVVVVVAGAAVVLPSLGTDVFSVVHTHDSVVPEEVTYSRKSMRKFNAPFYSSSDNNFSFVEKFPPTRISQ